MAEVIKVEDLKFHYLASEHAHALQGVSFSINEGEFCAIIGNNGSGKSTLGMALRGFVPQFFKGDYQGSISIAGFNPEKAKLADMADKVGYIFQNPFLQLSGCCETVYEELAFGLMNLGVPTEEICRRVDEVIESLRLNHLRDRYPVALSGGQQQLVAFASIITMDPDIYIIDEPTAQLDPSTSERVFEFIGQLKKQGKTILLIEHKMDRIARFADRVLVLHEGRVLADGDVRSVFNSPLLWEKEIESPSYTVLGIHAREAGLPCERLPVIEEEAEALLRRWTGEEVS